MKERKLHNKIQVTITMESKQLKLYLAVNSSVNDWFCRRDSKPCPRKDEIKMNTWVHEPNHWNLTWLLARIRMWPVTGASGLSKGFSILKFAKAFSPKIDFAYILAAMNPHCPESAFSGVRHFMLVFLSNTRRYSCKSVMVVLTATLFSHSNSTHIVRNSASEHEAGIM